MSTIHSTTKVAVMSVKYSLNYYISQIKIIVDYSEVKKKIGSGIWNYSFRKSFPTLLLKHFS